ncbi:hypothetical protein JGI15_11041, partial [Candidatus Kryptonium thompsonii]
IVVSEIGEQWSPKTPPLKTLATTIGKFESSAIAVGTAIGIIMAKVPQLVPVENEMKAEVTKTILGKSAGFINLLAI